MPCSAVAPSEPFDKLRDTYQAADGLTTGFGRTDLAGKSPADINRLFDQLSVLKKHGFLYTPDELRTMPPDVAARLRRYAALQARIDGLLPGWGHHSGHQGFLDVDLPAELVSDRVLSRRIRSLRATSP